MASSITAKNVADYLLCKVDKSKGDSITPLRLQKLVYYCQAWHLAYFQKPLFKEDIQAWAHGPVVPRLYRHHAKNYMHDAIDTSAASPSPLATVSDDSRLLIDKVWDKYNNLSGSALEELTHQESPWKKAYGDITPGGRCNVVISHKAMQDFYSKQISS